MRTRFFVRRTKPHASRKQRHFETAGIAAHEEFRAQIGDAVIAREHDEGMGRIMLDLEKCFAFVEPDDAFVGRHAGAQNRIGVEFDAAAIGERNDFVAANRGLEMRSRGLRKIGATAAPKAADRNRRRRAQIRHRTCTDGFSSA